jgi:hypothetical protein
MECRERTVEARQTQVARPASGESVRVARGDTAAEVGTMGKTMVTRPRPGRSISCGASGLP